VDPRGGMESNQGDQRSNLGWQDDGAEAPELFLTWMVAAAAVILLLLVAAVLAVQEQALVAEVQPRTAVTSPSPTVTTTPNQTLQAPSPVPTVSPVSSSAPASLCDLPPGWVEYRIRWGDSLSGLASKYNLSVQDLKDANCLERNTIFAGSSLWVPSGTGAPATGAVTSAPLTAVPGATESATEASSAPTTSVESGTPTRAAPLAPGTSRP
jgi:LysM repeat protein